MKVSVLMPTYNHETFIAEAIESFLAQQCNFDIELLIGNDASTDNTLKIAKKYADKFPDKIKLIDHPQNLGLLKNYKSIINVASGEYLAILESDDYWTDNFKLQKQVDFLDTHPACGISFTRWERLRDGKLELQPDESAKHRKYQHSLYESFLLWHNKIRATTACFRRSLFDKYCNIDEYISNDFQTIDYPVFISIIRHSEIHYIPTSTAVYRILETSISHNRDWEKALKYQLGVETMRQYIISLYGKGKLSDFRIINRETFLKFKMALTYKKYVTAFEFLFFETLTRSIDTIHKKIRIAAKDFRDFKKGLMMYSWFHKTENKPQIAVLLVDGKYSHGGFCDRLKGIVSLFHYAQVNNIPFRIDYTYPFKLCDFLISNDYDWLPKDGEISRNLADVKYICLVRDPSAKRLLQLKTKKQIHCHANRDIVEQLNVAYQTNFNWSSMFNRLFKPTNELSNLIANHKKQMGNNYISAQFRFINLLGDFKDNRKFSLTGDQKESLIEKNLQAVKKLNQQYPEKMIFVATDSVTFSDCVSQLNFVYTLSGNIVHIDYIEGEKRSAYERVFLDFYLLAESERIFSIGTKEMYLSEFPLYAAKVNGVPFERIEI
jgi:glycosyltransferase involved in cell wall biosynthesis